jgi:hypothetical protein
MVQRARAWLAAQRPMLTWAPLWEGERRMRHAWEIMPNAGMLTPHRPGRTVCGIETQAPTDFTDSSDVRDCEACRDGAAAPLVALLAEEREIALRDAATRCIEIGGQGIEGIEGELGPVRETCERCSDEIVGMLTET